MADRRTRGGKIVGSYKPPLPDYTYWAERQGFSSQPHYGEDGYVVVAPSGARLSWHRTEDEARMEVKRKQREARRLADSA